MKRFRFAILLSGIFLVAWTANADSYERALTDFKNRQYASAYQQFRQLSQEGDSRAQNTLAMMYIKGYGINADPGKAEPLLLNAANQGNVDAQTNLGQYYELGYSAYPNYAEAFRWYEIAASQGDPRAQYFLGKLYMNGKGIMLDRDKAFDYFVQSANAGFKPSIQILFLHFGYKAPQNGSP